MTSKPFNPWLSSSDISEYIHHLQLSISINHGGVCTSHRLEYLQQLFLWIFSISSEYLHYLPLSIYFTYPWVSPPSTLKICTHCSWVSYSLFMNNFNAYPWVSSLACIEHPMPAPKYFHHIPLNVFLTWKCTSSSSSPKYLYHSALYVFINYKWVSSTLIPENYCRFHLKID